MNISVVICTKGREYVWNTIESLKKQTHPVEIIIVDDGSKKLTELSNMSDVVYLRNKEPKGLSVCRNVGVKRSFGKIIAFIDDDAFADPNWIREIEQCFYNGADIAGGLIEPAWEAKKPWWLKESMYHLLGINTSSHIIFGCNFAIRKDLLEEMRYWFEEKLGRKEGNLIAGDETTLFFKAKEQGYKIIFNGKAVIYHIVSKQRLTLRYFIQRFFWEGRTETRRGTAKGYFIGRLLYLLFYAYRIIKSKCRISDIEDFFINVFFSVPYFYGMLYELAFGATDYRKF